MTDKKNDRQEKWFGQPEEWWPELIRMNLDHFLYEHDYADDFFKGKKIVLPFDCDDNFSLWKYFTENAVEFGIAEIMSVCYRPPVVSTFKNVQPTLVLKKKDSSYRLRYWKGEKVTESEMKGFGESMNAVDDFAIKGDTYEIFASKTLNLEQGTLPDIFDGIVINIRPYRINR